MGGAVLGAGLAIVAVRDLVAAAPASIPRLSEIGVDGWALGATVAITALAAVLSGLVPALVVAQADRFTQLRATCGVRGGRRAVRVRAAIVIVQLAVRPDAQVALVSQETVRRCWPTTDPIGHRLRVRQQLAGEEDFGELIDATVIGIVGDVKHDGLQQPPQPGVYLPITQPVWPVVWLIVRTPGSASALLPVLRQTIRSVDPDIPITESASIELIVASTLDPRRFTMWLLGAFAVVALGLIGTVAFARTLNRLLFGISALDLLTLAAVLLVLFVVAGYLPARRAARIDPVVALRTEG